MNARAIIVWMGLLLLCLYYYIGLEDMHCLKSRTIQIIIITLQI